VRSFLLGGGVARNRYIRKRFQEILGEKKIKIFIPDEKLCMDNGVMIAITTSFLLQYGISPSSNTIEVIPT